MGSTDREGQHSAWDHLDPHFAFWLRAMVCLQLRSLEHAHQALEPSVNLRHRRPLTGRRRRSAGLRFKSPPILASKFSSHTQHFAFWLSAGDVSDTYGAKLLAIQLENLSRGTASSFGT